jgi:hypothetical protein
VLNLSADGKVKECLSVRSGWGRSWFGRITEWLRGLQFPGVAMRSGGWDCRWRY